MRVDVAWQIPYVVNAALEGESKSCKRQHNHMDYSVICCILKSEMERTAHGLKTTVRFAHCPKRILLRSLVLSFLRHHKGDSFDGDKKSVTLNDSRDTEMLKASNNDVIQMLMASDIIGCDQVICQGCLLLAMCSNM